MTKISQWLQSAETGLPQEYQLPMLLLSILIAAIICFLGYRMLQIWIALCGFFIGLLIGGIAANYFWANNIVTIIAAVILGILIGMIAFKIYKAAFFVISFIFVFAFSAIIIKHFNVSFNAITYILMTVISIGAGCLCMMCLKPACILITAFQGGMILSSGVFKLLHMQNSSQTLIFVIGFIIAAAGILVQFSSCRNVEHIPDRK